MKPGPRIAVIGTTGCGKTTLAAHLAARLHILHIELDALHWQKNWVPVGRECFRQRVSEALTGPAWVMDGNYGKARDLIWSRATTLVWLDYALPVILWQLFRRTVQRIAGREELWNGNRETFANAFLSKDSLFLWALSSHPRYRKEFPELLARPEYAHLQCIRLHSRSETRRWLATLESTIW